MVAVSLKKKNKDIQTKEYIVKLNLEEAKKRLGKIPLPNKDTCNTEYLEEHFKEGDWEKVENKKKLTDKKWIIIIDKDNNNDIIIIYNCFKYFSYFYKVFKNDVKIQFLNFFTNTIELQFVIQKDGKIKKFIGKIEYPGNVLLEDVLSVMNQVVKYKKDNVTSTRNLYPIESIKIIEYIEYEEKSLGGKLIKRRRQTRKGKRNKTRKGKRNKTRKGKGKKTRKGKGKKTRGERLK